MTGEDPVGAVRELVTEAGIAGRRVRLVVALLVDEPHTLASLVTASGVDRRTAEAVLAALAPDLVTDAQARVRIAPARSRGYRELAGSMPPDGWRWLPYSQLLTGHADLVARLAELVATAPAARRRLDHVAATARTIALRALWLDATFELDGAAVLCVGDHDLTSLALHAVNPQASVTVVDVDDGVLEHIGTRSGGAVRCLWGDLRFGLPPDLHGGVDLVVTDPPYTPEGVRLFLTRGLQALGEGGTGPAQPRVGASNARLVMAYGFGEQPALGVKVQQAVTDLQLAIEAILPDFNRYHGAQAVGSSSDLYVLRPTPRSLRLAAGAHRSASLGIYTHGGQSVESGADAALGDLADPLLAAASGPHQLPVAAVVGPGWPAGGQTPVVELGELFGGAQPPPVLGRPGAAHGVAVDLRADPGAWLVRVLLAASVARLAILVPNAHPDLADERAQRALHDLVAAKYRLRLRRSTPGSRLAIVEAQRVEPIDPPGLAVRGVLDRAHGKLANTWREALVVSSGGRLTRNEARELVRTPSGAQRLLALPRHRLADVVAAVSASASELPGSASAGQGQPGGSRSRT